MTQAFIPDYGTTFSVLQLSRNRFFYNELRITNAARSQFAYERYEKLPVENPSIGMKMIKGSGR
jgi:hypothetical protein